MPGWQRVTRQNSMCRIAAWTGDEMALADLLIKPAHSLLSQSQHASEAKLAVNGDGFGFAWYGSDPEPGVYRDVLPAWSDGNLLSLARMIRTRQFIAHIRASTEGETSRANCHPFAHGRWSFCHNGQVPHFARIRRKLEAALPDDLYAKRRGTTDSEVIFLTLLANGLEFDPEKALVQTIAGLGGPTSLGPVRLTLVFSDGTTLYALRHASDRRCPTLYLSSGFDARGIALASEPLCGEHQHWKAIPPDTFVRIRDGRVHVQPLDIARAAA